MYKNSSKSDAMSAIARYFDSASLPTQQETLGSIASEILRAGKSLNRTAMCSKLIRRLELAGSAEEEQHYFELLGILFGRKSAN
ncbi:two-component-system connector protein YcgZ [Pantoea ananatis]|uniref:regulatory protein YcgZ n=1 Tax=Pantoea ananas TaxID=553 RepID=UPI000B7DA68F|nr:regulatory protein YcgZ [Pantoea ananatis]MBN6029758.1 two-component-system connector protein YcgZ [Pantoea ananatis]PZD65030.1 two-component-system connector protein YcgZ [Pantoea ananatis]PZD67854.1 two-component-system connector protein YcgZ [Pantoea ananatis]PZD69609.1 two-component-system connector protein YcgZ [Pantoea ananatis]